MAVRIRRNCRFSLLGILILRRRVSKMASRLFPSVHAEISMALVDEAEIAELNSSWLGSEGPTDVISFPLFEPAELERLVAVAQDPKKMLPLGDIVISVPVALSQARENGNRLIDELTLLSAHGLLHLAGYSHAVPVEADRMRKMELLLAGRTIIRRLSETGEV